MPASIKSSRSTNSQSASKKTRKRDETGQQGSHVKANLSSSENQKAATKQAPTAPVQEAATTPVQDAPPIPAQDAIAPPPTTAESKPEPESPIAFSFPSYARPSATKALQKQLRQIIKLQAETTAGIERYWTLDTSKLDDLYTWNFTLHTFDPDIPLSKGLKQFNLDGVKLEIRFGPTHPTTPPFVRVVKPRFVQWMNGGGGHVTAGGSICIAMLTMDSWQKDITIDNVLMTVHLALSDLEPVPARVLNASEYTLDNAALAYERVARNYGWPVPYNWNRLFTKGQG